ncbi:hypothetical protein EVAR_53621_1 [Eumeta japonica]|uniref:Histone-lysine N-methyltransferase SETMAR n=1 Tax=Eumeta variegata TaxID=151549 RepID=A0A4C1X2K1_EUMVA|nr:hypothetical protein EVAR_53621_1 [Eumeta japonica]
MSNYEAAQTEADRDRQRGARSAHAAGAGGGGRRRAARAARIGTAGVSRVNRTFDILNGRGCASAFLHDQLIIDNFVRRNRRVSHDLFCEQLMSLKQEGEKKRLELINRNGVVFHKDNARPHKYLATQQNIERVWLGSDNASTI